MKNPHRGPCDESCADSASHVITPAAWRRVMELGKHDRFLLVSPPSESHEVGVLLIDGLWRCCWMGARRIPFGGEYVTWREAHAAAELVRQEWEL